MGKLHPALTPRLTSFIEKQHLFFVATAAPEGRVNVSPKGMDTLRVQGPGRILWLNLTGSGNETAAHLLKDPRLTLMFCAFEGPPMILRVYGKARSHYPGEPLWEEYIREFTTMAGARQLISLEVGSVQTSCGMGVPLMEFKGDRDMLEPWAREKGPEGLREYRENKNRNSLDGFPTGLPEK